MIPIRDDNPTHRPAYVVLGLLAINIVVFLFVQPTLRQEGRTQEIGFFVCRAAIPYEVTRGEVLADIEDLDPPGGPRQLDPGEIRAFERSECPDKNVWLSMLFSMFFHGGWLHIAGNMLFLWVFGNNIEDSLGHIKFLVFYLLAGFAATFAQSYLGGASDTIPLIGASGAIAGVLGAYLLLFPAARVTTLIFFFFITWIELPAVVVLGGWFVLQVFNQLGSVTQVGGGVAYLAHIGGFVAGVATVLLFRPRRRGLPARARRYRDDDDYRYDD